MSIQTETAKLSDKALDEYVVLVPISDNFSLFCDDKPKYETSEVRLSIFTKGNYMQLKNRIVNGLLNNNFTITDKRYVEYENDTGFHHRLCFIPADADRDTSDTVRDIPDNLRYRQSDHGIC